MEREVDPDEVVAMIVERLQEYSVEDLVTFYSRNFGNDPVLTHEDGVITAEYEDESCSCGEDMDTGCNGNMRCPTCDGPCPCCDDGGGPTSRASDSEPVNLYYPGAECPDCGEFFEDDKEAGDQCDGCGHVFSQDEQLE